MKLLKSIVLTSAAITSFSALSQDASKEMAAVQKQLQVMTNIIKSSINGDNKGFGHGSSIDAMYLKGQGAVFTINANSYRIFSHNMEIITPVPPVAPVAPGVDEDVRIEIIEAQEEARAMAIEALENDREIVYELHEQQRDIARDLRDVEREVRDIEFRQRMAEKDEKKELDKAKEQLEKQKKH